MAHRTRAACSLAVAALLGSVLPIAEACATTPLKVCATSDNFPYSDRAHTGFENRLAEFVAHKLGTAVSYTWWPARENFLDKTLKAGACDVVMGVPVGLGNIEVTAPYYRSAYVFVSRTDAHLGLSSLKDERLRRLRIGVYVVGDNPTPPALALAQDHISANVRGFVSFYDRSADGKTSGLITALTDRQLDVAAVWGPLVGYYVLHASVPLTLAPIQDTQSFAPLVFRYNIGMGVRLGDDALCERLNGVISRNGDGMRHILSAYGVPLLPEKPEAAY